MNNKLRHVVIFLFDLLSIGVLWIGFDKIQQTLMELNNQVEIIRFGSRDGFFVAGTIVPLMHLLISIEQLCPDFIKKIEKYKKSVNYSIMGFVVAMLIAGFAISSWLQSRAEYAGYVHCRYVSGVSALAKTLVYTKEVQICEDLEAKARAERKRR
jgi:hypothetical protein